MTELAVIEIENGITKCYENSIRLIEDAKLLIKSKRNPTAFALLQLSLEEIAKTKILIRLALEKRSEIVLMDNDRKQYFNRIFSNHIEKNILSSITDKTFNEFANRINLQTFRNEQTIQNEIDNPKQLDIKKQNALYVYIERKKFKSPTESISPTDCVEKLKIIQFRFAQITNLKNYYFTKTNWFVERFKEAIIQQTKTNH
jgi:AbiV family abortive infection protein